MPLLHENLDSTVQKMCWSWFWSGNMKTVNSSWDQEPRTPQKTSVKSYILSFWSSFRQESVINSSVNYPATIEEYLKLRKLDKQDQFPCHCCQQNLPPTMKLPSQSRGDTCCHLLSDTTLNRRPMSDKLSYCLIWYFSEWKNMMTNW